jgi:sulfur-oxidizing protein SoxX
MDLWREAAVILLPMGIAACSNPIARDALDEPFAAPGDPSRGKEIFISRDGGHCVLCHAAPGVSVSGNVGPSLAGVGSRLSPAQIRLRIADITRVNADAAMPVFHGAEGERVAARYAGRTPLSGQQVEDLVAWLGNLK